MKPIVLDMISLAAALGGAACGFLAWRRAQGKVWTTADAGAADNTPQALSWWRGWLSGPAYRLRPAGEELELLTLRLSRAGRRRRDEVERFLQERLFGLALGLLAGFLLLLLLRGGAGFLLMLTSFSLGWFGPSLLLDAKGKERREAIARDLPAAVDLLTTCLGAGLSLDQAFARVGSDLAHSSPILAAELRQVGSEMEAGVSLPDALRRLGRRVGLDDLSALCGVIAQAHGLGAPIGQTLREYAFAARKQRLSRLEEEAGKLSTKLTIPLALCLLPASLLIILGPAAVQLMRALR